MFMAIIIGSRSSPTDEMWRWAARCAAVLASLILALATCSGAARADGWAPQPVRSPEVAGGELSAISCSNASDCLAVGSQLDRYGETVPVAMEWNGSSWSMRSPGIPAGGRSAALTAVSCAGGACLALGAYTTDTGSAPLAERWDGSSWTQQAPASPAAMGVTELSAVSCSSVAECMVVGAAVGADGLGIPIAEQVSGSTWTPQTLPEPAGTSELELNAISCADASMCMAVGGSGPLDVAGTPLAEQWDGSTWSATSLPSPGATNFQTTFEAVSCPSAGWCAAVGNAAGVGAQTLAEVWNAGGWAVQPTPGVNAGAGQMSAIACRSASDCTAAGYTDATSPVNGQDEQVPIAEGWDGSSWTQQTLASEVGISATLSGVACPADGDCRAAGESTQNGTAIQFPVVQALSDGTWSNDPMPDTGGGESNALQAISCPDAGFCMAVGDRPYGPLGASLAEQFDGTAWTPEAPPNPPGWADSDLYGVSCTSSRFCVAVGDWQVPFDPNVLQTQQPLAVTWDGSQWSVALPPPLGRYAIPDLLAVSCASASFCMAVGETTNGAESAPLADQWDGTGWTQDTVPQPVASNSEESHLTGVSCVSASACTAVGYLVDDTGSHALAETWDGSTWTIATVPDPSGSTNTRLNQVACFAGGCEATGTEYDTADGYQSFAEGGSSVDAWAVQPTPRPPLRSAESGLNGISCASGADCDAVGYFFPGTMAMFAAHWDGVGWSATAPPYDATLGYPLLLGVSCSATDRCTAIGYQRGTNVVSQAELFSGVAPTPTASNQPTVTGAPISGQELTVEVGGWTANPGSYYHQWEDCDLNGANCTPIPGAMGLEYELTQSDVGHTIEVFEYANDAGSVGGPAASAPTNVVVADTAPPDTVPSNALAPTITGTTVEGATLTAATGVWTEDPTSYAYSWWDCDSSGGSCVEIAGATGQTYSLTANDVGHTIRASVAALNAAGGGTPATSEATSVVLATWFPSPTAAGPPWTTVPPPTQITPTASVVILTGRAAVNHGRVAVMVRCRSVTAGSHSCGGRLTLIRRVTVRHAHRPPTIRTVTLAQASYFIPAGAPWSVRLRLTPATTQLVAARRHGRLAATAVAATEHGTTQRRPLVLEW